jgi:hypothetical protein
MFIQKRDGRRQSVSFDKVTARINKLSYGLNTQFVDPLEVSQKVRFETRPPAPSGL